MHHQYTMLEDADLVKSQNDEEGDSVMLTELFDIVIRAMERIDWGHDVDPMDCADIATANTLHNASLRALHSLNRSQGERIIPRDTQMASSVYCLGLLTQILNREYASLTPDEQHAVDTLPIAAAFLANEGSWLL